MAIRFILCIVFTFTLGQPSAVDAATLPNLGTAPAAPTRSELPVPRPEPAALQAGWWRYFEVQGKELDRHILDMSQRLQTLLDQLPQRLAGPADSFIKRIESNMDALAQARAQPAPVPPPPAAFREIYIISQLLAIAGRLQNEQARLPAERSDVASTEKAIRAASHGIDTQLAAYLSLAPNNSDRVLHGLEIIADRLALGVAEEQLRVRKASLAVEETLANQLAEEQAAAIDRLVAEHSDLSRLEGEIAQAKAALKEAQERLLKDQTLALSVVADNPADKAAAPYRQQLAVSAAAREAIATAQLISLQAEFNLASLLLGTAEADTKTLRVQLDEQRAQIADIRQQAIGWKSDSQTERERASEAMAAMAAQTDNVVPIQQVLFRDRMVLAQDTLVALQRLESGLNQVDLLTELVNRELSRREGGLRDWLVRGELALQEFRGQIMEWITVSLFKIGDTPVTTLGLLRVAFILFLAWLISYWLRNGLERIGRRHEGVTQSALYTVERLSHYLIITFGFIIGLSSIGVDFTNFAIVAGAIGIGIGFGLQSIVNNFVSGLILLFERTLKVGDFVELSSGVTGEVRAINVRSTLINTNDNVDIVVPNSEFINTNVTNWTLLEAYRRIHIPFRVAYGSDIDVVTQAALEAAENTPHTLKDHKPGVWLVDFGESSLKLELVVWITPSAVKRPGAVNAAYKREIERALRKYKLQIPFPQRDLHLRSGFKEFIESDMHARS